MLPGEGRRCCCLARAARPAWPSASPRAPAAAPRHQTATQALAGLSDDIRADPFLHPHFRHYLREVRGVAYAQVRAGQHTRGARRGVRRGPAWSGREGAGAWGAASSGASLLQSLGACRRPSSSHPPPAHLASPPPTYCSLTAHLPTPQFLESYKSVTLGAMAAAFGVSPAFLDAELVGWLACWPFLTCLLACALACLHAWMLACLLLIAWGTAGRSPTAIVTPPTRPATHTLTHLPALTPGRLCGGWPPGRKDRQGGGGGGDQPVSAK